MIPSVDLSVVVTAHKEDHLVVPTLLAVEAALAEVEAGGWTAEVIVVADSASDNTRHLLGHWQARSNCSARVLDVRLGEPGASRNAGVRAANGAHVAVCDGDDLFTSDLFVTALRILKDHPQSIVHPATVLSFGDRSLLWHVRSSTEAGFSYLDMLTSNPWPSCSITRREHLLRIPYPELPPGSGFGPEDYFWNLTTASAGLAHLTAPGSFHFYRTRSHGGVNNANASAILPWFDMDQLMSALPARPQEDARNLADRIRRLTRAIYRRTKRLGGWIPFRTRQKMYLQLSSWAGLTRWKFVDLPEDTRRRVADCAELEPALSWALYRLERMEVEVWRPPSSTYAAILVDTYAELRSHADVMVLAPWVGVGGADLVARNYLSALLTEAATRDRVSLLTTAAAERTLTHLLPSGTRRTQLPPEFRALHESQRSRLVAQLLVLLRPKVILSIGCFDFTQALVRYGAQLGSSSAIFLSLFGFDHIGMGSYPTNPITDDSQRNYLGMIAGIITDNSKTATRLELLGLSPEKVRVHYQPAVVRPVDKVEAPMDTAAWRDGSFSRANPFEVIWPHRLDREKRPDAVIEIARSFRARKMPARIHVFGTRVLHAGDPDPTRAMRKAGVVLHGPYNGGLVSLPMENYHTLLLTSENEGLPLTLVQAMLLGVPVVASNVGGVSDIVTHEETGLLVSGPDDIEGFVRAIEMLIESRELRRRLIHAGYNRAVEQHSATAFAARVRAEFSPYW